MNSALPSSSQDALLGDPGYLRLKEHVIRSTGLSYYQDKDADLAGRIGRRLTALDLKDCTAYHGALRDPLRGAAELDALVGEITIGESYFFRHREHFDALRDIVLPDLIERNAGRKILRVWCAGCADGAEPYSLSILLHREFAGRLAGWDVSILGTDINREFLSNARKGKFEEWSLRSTSEEFRRECFVRDGRKWELTTKFKQLVSFQYHNLAGDDAVSPGADERTFDLIICRNVMIYFGGETMLRVIHKFHNSLAAEGWLLVGPSEPNMTSFTSFKTVNAQGVTLYQKPRTTAPHFAHCSSVTPVTPPTASKPTKSPDIIDSKPEPARREKTSPQAAPSDHLNPLLHFHQALMLEQVGNLPESERSLRKAIYLDRQLVLPHYYLGLLLRTTGEKRQAARAFENTLKLLDARSSSETIANADGLTVAELRRLVEAELKAFGEQGHD